MYHKHIGHDQGIRQVTVKKKGPRTLMADQPLESIAHLTFFVSRLGQGHKRELVITRRRGDRGNSLRFSCESLISESSASRDSRQDSRRRRRSIFKSMTIRRRRVWLGAVIPSVGPRVAIVCRQVGNKHEVSIRFRQDCESAIKNWKPARPSIDGKEEKRRRKDQKQIGAQNSVRPFCQTQKPDFAQSFAQKETGSSLLHKNYFLPKPLLRKKLQRWRWPNQNSNMKEDFRYVAAG